MRPSQRQTNQLRPSSSTRNFYPPRRRIGADQMGDTHVLCNASVEESLPGFLRGKGPKAGSPPNTACCPASTHTRSVKPRGASQTGRTQEIQRPDRPFAARG